MAKKAKKDKKPPSRADQLRAAVEGAFGATAHGAAPVGKRAQELADELVSVASRLREALGSDEQLSRLRASEPAAAAAKVREAVEGLRPPTGEQVEALRAQVAALEARVAALEAAAAKPAPASRRRAPARKPAGAAAKASPRASKPTAATKRAAPAYPAAPGDPPTDTPPPATGGDAAAGDGNA
jgi:polyhydroxyalkanoate synthesis regulator phasin